MELGISKLLFMVCIDLTAAFDMVDHAILEQKCRNMRGRSKLARSISHLEDLELTTGLSSGS